MVNQQKKKGKKVNFKRVSKKKWVAQFPWVELVVNPIGKIHMMHCKVCSMVEGKEKIINLKLNGLQEPVRKMKALVPCPRIWWVIIISTMATNVLKMKVFMPVGTKIIFQS